ncbi:response regulator [Sphingomonas radiodurans]|uniref:response regulator n=1 Tax=Sphingomonas radiodurans TaxID=2890321 RepID=UPI001E2E82D5|nr:response regulator [Sphingomonas radiodurans]WBH16319.1 response regulator [Sphingomonas radiodurans]
MTIESQAMLAGRTVLVIEDDYFIAEDMACQLAANGAEIIGPAASVDAAMALIEQTERIDGAVMDINLQGLMAWPIADALLKRGVHFVFATGYDSASIPARYAEIIRCEKPADPNSTAKALFG